MRRTPGADAAGDLIDGGTDNVMTGQISLARRGSHRVRHSGPNAPFEAPQRARRRAVVLVNLGPVRGCKEFRVRRDGVSWDQLELLGRYVHDRRLVIGAPDSRGPR